MSLDGRFRNEEYLWWQVAEYTIDTFMIRCAPNLIATSLQYRLPRRLWRRGFLSVTDAATWH